MLFGYFWINRISCKDFSCITFVNPTKNDKNLKKMEIYQKSEK